MLLTIDIGNTTVAVGGFLGPELRFVRRLPSDRNMDAAACAARMRTLLAEEGAAPQDVEGAVLSSVVPSLTQVAVQAAEALTRRPVRVLGRDLDPGLPTGDYDASNLGMDRLVDCVAALARWRPPLAVFDMGTATTLSVVDREGVFRGGMILPGLRLSVDALSARAAQLPCITFTQPEGLLGTDTVSCMRSGALYGAAAALEEKTLLDKLWETYELSHEAARAQRVELESVPKAQRRVGELKKAISGLGNINLDAIEEFQRVNERYTYLTDQRDDVLKSKKELEGIIADITEEMKTIFARQFSVINEAFQQTFTELFGGGKATLELEEPEDILNCGIEIRVQPPGKALKVLSLLSGGEKAFVAIALYFAILKVRPTPFCVMDEIEAALDDANVVRFARYMRQMADKTQFIVITHRRGTMEEADVLYGVTMQEQGVSRILTINLNDVEKELHIK